MDERSLQKKLKFIDDYFEASNASTGSQYDSNANVTCKNLSTLTCELSKKDLIDIHRAIVEKYIRLEYGEEDVAQYRQDVKNHLIYPNDESSIFPYCCSISLYPFVLDGLKPIGGTSAAPKHANSFIGGLINLVYMVASQFAGACMYKDQKVLVKIHGIPYSLTSQQLFEKLATELKTFDTLTDHWEYSAIDNAEIEIFEDNKWVALNKVLRRPYKDKIYKITTKSGKSVLVSQDHKFKHLYRNRIFETKAKDLALGDTIFANYEFDSLIDPLSEDYRKGQIIGLIAGDGCIQDTMVSIAINAKQEFIADFLDQNLSLLNIPVCEHTRKLDNRKGADCFRYYIGSTKAADIVKSYFKTGCYSTFTKNVDLSDKSLNWQCGFLDGLLTADGSYSKGHCLSITLTNEPLLKTVQQILNNLYLDTNITCTPAHDNKSAIYKCHIPMSGLKFLSLVKQKPCYSSLLAYNNRKHINKKHDSVYYAGITYGSASASKTTSNSDHKLNLFTDVIVDIQTFDNDADYVYEVETATHWYNCGGLITHNCAIPEFLCYFDHFLRVDYGDDYIEHLDEPLEVWGNLKSTLRDKIEDWFQQIIHSINEPAGARNYQSPFTNIAYFDKYYFNSIFKDFVFPDGDEPKFETTKELEKMFMIWFNKEREVETLTFPVETANILVENGQYKDTEMADFFAESWSRGHSFFLYQSDSVDALASCCRLRNEVENNVFSYTLGAGGIQTGSKNVITLNLNRIVQNWDREGRIVSLADYIATITKRVHKYLNAWNAWLWHCADSAMLPIYKAGYIDLDKQFLTVGVNGFVEGAEYLGITIDPNNKEYQDYAKDILGTIKKVNTEDRTPHARFNTECVPGENLSVKLYAWDKADGYKVPAGRNLYNSYFYIVEDPTIDPVAKFFYQGTGFASECDGGVALHNNLEEILTKQQYRHLMDVAVQAGCNYFTYNIPATICNDCGFRSKHYYKKCQECGSENLDYETRIIGYLKRVSNFSEARQAEAAKRFYGKL